VDNANFAELIVDQREKGHLGYLQARERKKLASAVQESEVDVADAEQMGDIGKKVREAKTRQEIARLETETKTYEYETQKQMAERYASLAEAQADSQRREDVSKIEAQAAAALKKEELQHAIELARAQQELAAKKALLFTSAKVQAECDVAEAEGKRDASVIESEGNAQALERLAIAHQREGEAKAAALRAELMAKAEGQAAMLEAQATGTRNLVTACGGNPQLLEPVLNIYNHVPQKIAEEGAKAVQGLNPQIWSLSGEDAGSSVARLVGGMAPVVDMFKRHGVFNALTSPIEATKPTAAKSTDAKPVD
jgi:flotillin